MKIKAYKTEDEIPEGAVYLNSVEEHGDYGYSGMYSKVFHYFLVKDKVITGDHEYGFRDRKDF